MKFLLTLLVSFVIIASADDHDGDKVKTTATAAVSTAVADAKDTGNDIIKVADDLAGKTEDEILALSGSFNGTDTTDQGFTYNYKEGGDDWPKLKSKYGVDNNCGKKDIQSPINLLQPIWSYGWAYGDTIPKMNDAHETTYSNLRKGVEVKWPKNINSLQVKLQEIESLENFFVSNIAETYYGASTNKFAAEAFFIRSPSEHTLMGKHLDIEL